MIYFFFFSSRRRHTRFDCDWSSDVCSSDLGWVSLALKIFYPDAFNAVWSSCPDGVDFRGFQLVNIYKDKNAYFDESGSERPSKRDINGNVEFTIRHECQMENVMGPGDSWTMSGQQW